MIITNAFLVRLIIVCSIAAKVGWLATIDDDQENLELIRLKWRTFVVYFNPKQVIEIHICVKFVHVS